MQAYAKAEVDARDSSVELYLLNHWVKELSLRDLIDEYLLHHSLMKSIS